MTARGLWRGLHASGKGPGWLIFAAPAHSSGETALRPRAIGACASLARACRVAIFIALATSSRANACEAIRFDRLSADDGLSNNDTFTIEQDRTGFIWTGAHYGGGNLFDPATGKFRRFLLAPASYVFRVKASNDDGLWNEAGTALPFTILPPWWMTGWFRAPVAMPLLGATASVFLWQRRPGPRRERVLQRLVTRRTHELEIARDEADANKAKSISLSSMSHELRTPPERHHRLCAGSQAARSGGRRRQAGTVRVFRRGDADGHTLSGYQNVDFQYKNRVRRRSR